MDNVYANLITWLFDNLIVVFIALCFTVGLLCSLCSMWRIRTYKKQLAAFKADQSVKLKNTHSEDARIDVLLEWLTTHASAPHDTSQNTGELNSHAYSPLYMRVYSLYRALLDDNGSRQLPQLHDLRELALQDEMSRFSVATLRTIIAFLLIVGIFGTLYGIHDVIEGLKSSYLGDLKIEKLRPALEPSMCAVACTVLLMWMRGFFSYFLQRYLLDLDQITMEELLPRLQPESRTQESHKNFDTHIEGFSESMGKMSSELQSLKQSIHTLKEQVAPYHEFSKRLRLVVDKTTGTAERISESQKEQLMDFAMTKTYIDAGKEDLVRMSAMVDTLHQYTEAAADARSAYEQLTDVSSRSMNLLTTNMQLMSNMAHTALQLPTYVNDIRKYVDDIDKTIQLRINIDTALQAITTQLDSMQQLSTTSYTTVQEAQACLNTAIGHLTEIANINTQYNSSLEKGIEMFNTAYEEVKQDVENLDQANSYLLNVFTMRKKIITSSSKS